MSKMAKKLVNQLLRKTRVRARMNGTDQRPRLSVFISNQHVSAQIINDEQQKTLVSSTTAIANNKAASNKTEKAAWVGTDIAKKAKKAGVKQVVFDRGERQYKRRLQALADAARKEGLEF